MVHRGGTVSRRIRSAARSRPIRPSCCSMRFARRSRDSTGRGRRPHLMRARPTRTATRSSRSTRRGCRTAAGWGGWSRRSGAVDRVLFMLFLTAGASAVRAVGGAMPDPGAACGGWMLVAPSSGDASPSGARDRGCTEHRAGPGLHRHRHRLDRRRRVSRSAGDEGAGEAGGAGHSRGNLQDHHARLLSCGWRSHTVLGVAVQAQGNTRTNSWPVARAGGVCSRPPLV